MQGERPINWASAAVKILCCSLLSKCNLILHDIMWLKINENCCLFHPYPMLIYYSFIRSFYTKKNQNFIICVFWLPTKNKIFSWKALAWIPPLFKMLLLRRKTLSNKSINQFTWIDWPNDWLIVNYLLTSCSEIFQAFGDVAFEGLCVVYLCLSLWALTQDLGFYGFVRKKNDPI